MNNLSRFLKIKRQEKNMSLREFADYLGISHAYLSKLEKGIDANTGKEIAPTIDTLLKISDNLNMSSKRFFEICGFIEQPKNSVFSESNKTIDINDFVEDIVNSILTADNITFEESPIDKSDLETIADALQIGLQLVLKRNQNK